MTDRQSTSSWQKIIQRLAATRLASWILAPNLQTIDEYILQQTKGRHTATNYLTGLPVITLTTIGIKSGQPRKVHLVPLYDGDKIVLIASNFGSSHQPAWYYNLKAHPQAKISTNGSEGEYLAHEAVGAEREAYWDQAENLYQGYNLYRLKAGSRQIPVMVLVPNRLESSA